ncbi:TPA: TIGR03752 family integrating conjugative element protein [Legionella pneumophila]|nr:TIGR03752 family integrating conjugative element protein [Legionella pneumophila subsp. pneumophila]HAU0786445.1 TIGR03752 family integrating conjugative element protein [Legionella pneumophila]HAU0811878.1 TIGR03752 family integrating conjugative element protein [Legionella pneumophila]HAU0906880.1 TIGR03752 family integrating conjugative element protein [Legionella pneumophila]HAU0937534.1 TIGR03752 family integrating conjugative element protein [Legionella pneumophila]
MNKNSGIKILSGSVALVAILILFNSKSTPPAIEPTTNTNNFNEAIASQFNDNIRDVSARLQETEKRLEQMQQENKTLQTQLQQPKQDNNHKLKEELLALKDQIASIAQSKTKSYPMQGKVETKQIKDLDELLDKPTAEHKELSLWDGQKEKEEAPKATPFYTIPAGSDFSKVTLLSALIGEVPVEGKLMQPLFPFSAMVSRGDLMTANGMQLPDEIIGMKVSGYSIGVGSFLDNISCVRAYVTSALFVFDDGHFVTVGQEQMKSSAEMINNDSIGYLTTQYGNPCIKGQYITNAPQVLTSFMVAGGIQGAGNALSKWQMTYQAEGGNAIATPTGQLGNFAAGGALNEGSQKITDWMEKRIQGSFDMVFVPASLKVQNRFIPNNLSLHFNQTIAIDKEHNGRVLDYGHTTEKHFDNALR